MTQLSEQEVTLLELHAMGQSIAAIGAWEKPCDALVAKGYLQRHDKFNHSITPAGRAAWEEHDKETDKLLGKMIEQASVVGATQKGIRDFAEQAAQLLAQAAKESSKLLGDAPEAAAKKWSDVIFKRALEVLDGR